MGAMGDGKHTENYGKSQCLIGSATINIYKCACSIAMLVYQRASNGSHLALS